ncbi:MAG: dynamin family protein [Pseudolysinimonas sp.]
MGFIDGARALLAPAGYGDEVASILADLSTRSRGAHAVVVVGEVGTGKSTLVNVLLGVPGLSPTGPGETTATLIRFEPPTEGLPAGSARADFAGGESEVFPVDRLADRTVIERLADAPDGEIPRGVTVAAESPALPGVAIIDTPGTGGLDPAHGRVALASAERATILVLVTDAGGRLTEPALAFLDACASGVEAIVVAVNQIDQFPGWQTVVDENRAILEKRDPRYAGIPVIGVSALLAQQAASRTSPESRVRLEIASRFGVFVDAVTDLLTASNDLPAARALRRLGDLQKRVRAELEQQVDSLERANPLLVEELERSTAHLTTLQGSEAKWRRWLQRSIAQVSDQLVDEVRQRTDEYAAHWTGRINNRMFGVSKGALVRLQSDMDVEANVIYLDLDQHVRDRLTALCTDLFKSVDLGDYSEEVFGSEGIPKDERGLPQLVRRAGKADLDLSLLGMAMMGASALGAINPLLAPVGFAAVFGINLLSRGALKNKRDALAYVERMPPRVREAIQQRLNRVLWDYRDSIEEVFDRELKRAVKQANENLAIAQRAQVQTKEQRDTEVLELRKRIEIVDRELSRGAAERERLMATPAVREQTAVTGASNSSNSITQHP